MAKCSEEQFREKLQVSFAPQSLDLLAPLLKRRAHTVYNSHLVAYMTQHKCYGPKTVYHCLTPAIDEIVGFGETANGYIGQGLFENMQEMLYTSKGIEIANPPEMKIDSEQVETALDYFVTSIRELHPEKQFAQAYQQYFCRKIELIRY